MRKLITSIALLVAIGGPAAIAQTGGGTANPVGPAPKADKLRTEGAAGVPPAPVGHRQPRAADVPPEKNLSDPNDPLSRENVALDKKIKSICRGC